MSNVNLIPLATISNLFKLEVVQMPILSTLYMGKLDCAGAAEIEGQSIKTTTIFKANNLIAKPLVLSLTVSSGL